MGRSNELQMANSISSMGRSDCPNSGISGFSSRDRATAFLWIAQTE